MQNRKHQGFTIVELAVVVVVIGILAALTYVFVSGSGKRATEAKLRGDLASAMSQVKLSGFDKSNLPTLGSEFTSSNDATFTLRPLAGGKYCIDAVSKKNSDVKWHINSSETETRSGLCEGVADSNVATPTCFKGLAEGSSIRLTWCAGSDVKDYEIEWKSGANPWTSVKVASSETAWTHSSLGQNTTYEYRMRASYSDGSVSGWTDTSAKALIAPISGVTACSMDAYNFRMSWNSRPVDEVKTYRLLVNGVHRMSFPNTGPSSSQKTLEKAGFASSDVLSVAAEGPNGDFSAPAGYVGINLMRDCLNQPIGGGGGV